MSLTEGKAVGTYKRGTRHDLRAIEAQARAIVHGKKHRAVVKKSTAATDRQIWALKTAFRKRLFSDIKRFESGAVTHKELLKRATVSIRRTYEQAFELGLKAQGHGLFGPKAGTTSKATKDDRAWIDSAVEEESRYLKKFLGEIRRGEVPSDDDSEEERSARPKGKMKKERRVEMYTRAVDGVYAAGQVRGAPANAIIHWVYGHSEHCPECIYLESHSPYTRETLPTTPRAGSTRCLSNCKCKLAIDLAQLDVIATIEKTQHSKATHLRRLARSRGLRNGLPEVAVQYIKEEALSRVKTTRLSR